MQTLSLAPQVPWSKLLAWVEEKIALEKIAQTCNLDGRGQLSHKELEAISVLVSFHEEPSMNNVDYVSLLMRKSYNQYLRGTDHRFPL